MGRAIGVLASNQIVGALVEDSRLTGPLRLYPETESPAYVLEGMPAETITQTILRQIEFVRHNETIEAVGVAMPGIIRDGVIEESPNLPQTKGLRIQEALAAKLSSGGQPVEVQVFNDADAIAAGVAATQGHLASLIRVWNLGRGVGYGRYPWTNGIWEGGHSVVMLDPHERFCACEGRGHLEGIVGSRSMRLRFLDMEPEEIFAAAKSGDQRCADFVVLWHRALAAATASSIAMEGPGKFFITGPLAGFVELGRLEIYLHEMVKMSPLQGSQLQVIATSYETGIIGAAVNAQIAAQRSRAAGRA